MCDASPQGQCHYSSGECADFTCDSSLWRRKGNAECVKDACTKVRSCIGEVKAQAKTGNPLVNSRAQGRRQVDWETRQKKVKPTLCVCTPSMQCQLHMEGRAMIRQGQMMSCLSCEDHGSLGRSLWQRFVTQSCNRQCLLMRIKCWMMIMPCIQDENNFQLRCKHMTS